MIEFEWFVDVNVCTEPTRPVLEIQSLFASPSSSILLFSWSWCRILANLGISTSQ